MNGNFLNENINVTDIDQIGSGKYTHIFCTQAIEGALNPDFHLLEWVLSGLLVAILVACGLLINTSCILLT